MKRLIFLSFYFSTLSAIAQNNTTEYSDILSSTNEIYITDSISINNNNWIMNRLDTNIVRKCFSQLLPSSSNNRLKNRAYYLAGKVTTNTNFDLLVIIEEKKKSDSTNSRIVYLFTVKKIGTYISFLETIIAGKRKKSIFSTSSWIYNDFKIVQDYKIKLKEKIYSDLRMYKLNKTGRFILSPNY